MQDKSIYNIIEAKREHSLTNIKYIWWDAYFLQQIQLFFAFIEIKEQSNFWMNYNVRELHWAVMNEML